MRYYFLNVHDQIAYGPKATATDYGRSYQCSIGPRHGMLHRNLLLLRLLLISAYPTLSKGWAERPTELQGRESLALHRRCLVPASLPSLETRRWAPPQYPSHALSRSSKSTFSALPSPCKFLSSTSPLTASMTVPDSRW